jgi:benzodiazapine receptor
MIIEEAAIVKNVLKVGGSINLFALIISIIISESVGLLSGYLGMMTTDMSFYSKLQKPLFSPPGWVFPIVWGILYFLMGLAAYRVWMRGQQGAYVQKALILYIIQLTLNFLWTIIFFRFQLFGLAFLELLLLLIFILLTTFEFFKVDKISGILMLPYILWVTFAGILNFSIWLLNEA